MADAEDRQAVEAFAASCQADFRKEYSGTDGAITISISSQGEQQVSALTMTSKEKAVFFLMHIPYGIEKMSGEIEGLVETSNNIGILRIEDGMLCASCGIRSSVGSAKLYVSEKIQYLTEFLGGEYTVMGDYPAWEYKKDSALRELMADTYRELFGKEASVKAIHAGLECGLFYDKIPGLDCVSFGPSMQDIHTTEEKLSISSTARMWEYLVKVLENIRG